jgi:hypothetical protein
MPGLRPLSFFITVALKLLGLFHDPFWGVLQTSSKPMRLRRSFFVLPVSSKRALVDRQNKKPTKIRGF